MSAAERLSQGSESRAQSRSTAASLSMFAPRDRRLEPGSHGPQSKAAGDIIASLAALTPS